jgi:hypothetical protein
MLARILFWSVVVATIGVYATMILWSIPTISAEAGGHPIFDMRPTGYTLDEAERFLRALTPEGANLYLDVQHRLDLVYPALLAVSTGWALIRLVPRWRWRFVLLLVPIPGMVFDYLENHAVSAMLAAGADGLTVEIVARASMFSRLKAAFTTLSLVLLLILVFVGAFRWWRSRAV